jgi:hypothetical protein
MVFVACKDIIENYNIYDFHVQIRKIRDYDFLRAYDFVWYDHGMLFFGRFFGIIQVARLAICNIQKCSERFIVFESANSFPIEKF